MKSRACPNLQVSGYGYSDSRSLKRFDKLKLRCNKERNHMGIFHRFTVCQCCKQRKKVKNGCIFSHIIVGEKVYPRLLSGDVRDYDYIRCIGHVCHSCNVGVNQHHHFGCKAERCPVCRMRMFDCFCISKDKVQLVTTFTRKTRRIGKR